MALGGDAGEAVDLHQRALRRLRRCFPGAPVSAACKGVSVSAVIMVRSGAGGNGAKTTCCFFLCVTTVQSLFGSVVSSGVGTLGSGTGVTGVGMMMLGAMAAVASS